MSQKGCDDRNRKLRSKTTDVLHRLFIHAFQASERFRVADDSSRFSSRSLLCWSFFAYKNDTVREMFFIFQSKFDRDGLERKWTGEATFVKWLILETSFGLSFVLKLFGKEQKIFSSSSSKFKLKSQSGNLISEGLTKLPTQNEEAFCRLLDSSSQWSEGRLSKWWLM